MPARIITLTTDFGTRDWFVGTMKGVILGITPQARIVDITHEIPAGDIRAGAFALAQAAGHFPKGTIHVAVIDPGVGGKRRAIAILTKSAVFIGPDNGVLSLAAAGQAIKSVRAIENAKLFRRPVSRTFHGRDVFAPVAAHLARDLAPAKLGPLAGDFARLAPPLAEGTATEVRGEVVFIDHFGNAITNIAETAAPPVKARQAGVFSRRRRLCEVRESYSAVPVGKPVAVFGSTGFLEIAVNGGSAAERLGLRTGTRVELRAR